MTQVNFDISLRPCIVYMRSMTQVNFGISLDHVLSLYEIHDPSLFWHFLTPCIIYIYIYMRFHDPSLFWHFLTPCILYIYEIHDPSLFWHFLTPCIIYIYEILDPSLFWHFLTPCIIYIYEIHDPNFGIISLDHALFELELCAIVSYFCLFILVLLLLIFNWLLFFFKGEWSTHTHNIYI